MNAQQESPLLVDYVLRQMRVKVGVCTRQKWETGYTLASRVLRDYNYIYVTRGRVVWEIAGNAITMKPGTLVLVCPGLRHRGYALTKQLTFVSVHVEATLPGGQDVFTLLPPPAVIKVAADSPLDRYFRGALDEFARSEPRDIRLSMPGWAHLITLEFIRAAAAGNLLQSRPASPVIAQVLDYLHQPQNGNITLATLADHAGYTAQHLNRLFREELGTTPMKYLMRLRLEEAGKLLADGRLTIAAIARHCGFADPAYFSRVFHQHMGHSPAEYRKMRQVDEPLPA